MKKHVIALLLAVIMASGSVGAVPALATETTAEEAVAVEEESVDGQKEAAEIMEDSDFGLTNEGVLEEEYAQIEEDSVQEDENTEEEVTESEDEDDASAEATEIEEPLVIEEEVVTAEENEAVFAGDVIDSGKCGNNANWTLTGTGENLTLTISGTGGIDNYSESNIPWATKRSKIKTVIVENGITSIGSYAFCYLSKMTKVALSDTVTEILGYAFSHCTSLTSIEIPDSVTDIGGYAFNNCNNLISITIPDSVTGIGYAAFEDCTSLTSVTLPNSVTDVSGAFKYCTSLTSITIPNGVTDINRAFEGCSSLTSVTIPDSVTIIGNMAFSHCSSLTSVEIPNSVLIIEYGAFEYCSSLTRIEIPESVTSIDNWAFQSCSSLTSVTVPDSVVRIGKYAFGRWKDDTNATIRFRGTKEQWDAAVGNNEVRFKSIIYNCFSVPADFTLSDTSFVYTGEAVEPAVTVSYKGQTLEEGVDYKLEYKDNINAGTATVNVIGVGKYSGTEPLEYTIKPGKPGKTTRGDLFNLADNIKITWEAVPSAKYYKVYRNGVNEPVVVTTGLVGWDKCTTPKLEPGKMYTYKIVASTTGKGDSSGDSSLSYTKSIYRLQTTAFKYIKNTAPGKVTVSYKKSDYGDSYVLLYADNEEMKNAKSKVIYGADTTAVVLGGFKKGKTYWFQIRVRKSVAGYKLPFYTTFGAKKAVVIKQ